MNASPIYKKVNILGFAGMIAMVSVILFFAGACKKKSDQAQKHFDEGVKYEKEHKIEEAIREFKQAIQLSPDYADAHYHLGTLYHVINAYASAMEEYKKVLSINPKYHKVHTVIGHVYYVRGVKNWGRAIKWDQSFWLPDTLRQLPFKGKDELFKLIDEYQNKLETDTANAEIVSKLSQAYFILAAEEYEKAIQADSLDTTAQLYLGLTYSEQGYPYKAMTRYEILKRLDPRSGELLMTLIKQKEDEKQFIESKKK